MTRRALWLPVFLLALAAAPFAADARGDAGPELRFDPFVIPELDEQRGDLRRRGANRGRPRPGRAEAWQPVLRATLVAGAASLANLGGTILGPGEQTHGWTLVEVRRFEAVFLHQGERVVLGVQHPKATR